MALQETNKISAINQRINQRKISGGGFTLIEFLIYSVIVAFLVGVLVLMGTNILENRASIAVTEEVNHNGKMAMEGIAYHIRKAESINSPIQGAESNSLELEMDVSEEDPTVFEVDVGSRLTVKRGTAEAVSLTTEKVEVSFLSFTNVSYDDTPGTVRVKMTVKYINPAERSEYEFERTFYTTENIRR